MMLCYWCVWCGVLYYSQVRKVLCQSHNIQTNILVGLVDCLSFLIEHWGLFTQQLEEPLSSFKPPLSGRSLRSLFHPVSFTTSCICLSSAFSPNHFSANSICRSCINSSQNCLGHPGPIPDWVPLHVACSVQLLEEQLFVMHLKQLAVVECENLCNSVSWQSVHPHRAADVRPSDCALCVSVLVFLKEGKAWQGERPASTVDDTLDKYLIALQQKNR